MTLETPPEDWERCLVNLADHRNVGLATLEAHAAYLAGLGDDVDVRAMLEGFARTGGEGLGVELALALQVIEI